MSSAIWWHTQNFDPGLAQSNSRSMSTAILSATASAFCSLTRLASLRKASGRFRSKCAAVSRRSTIVLLPARDGGDLLAQLRGIVGLARPLEQVQERRFDLGQAVAEGRVRLQPLPVFQRDGVEVERVEIGRVALPVADLVGAQAEAVDEQSGFGRAWETLPRFPARVVGQQSRSRDRCLGRGGCFPLKLVDGRSVNFQPVQLAALQLDRIARPDVGRIVLLVRETESLRPSIMIGAGSGLLGDGDKGVESSTGRDQIALPATGGSGWFVLMFSQRTPWPAERACPRPVSPRAAHRSRRPPDRPLPRPCRRSSDVLSRCRRNGRKCLEKVEPLRRRPSPDQAAWRPRPARLLLGLGASRERKRQTARR